MWTGSSMGRDRSTSWDSNSNSMFATFERKLEIEEGQEMGLGMQMGNDALAPKLSMVKNKYTSPQALMVLSFRSIPLPFEMVVITFSAATCYGLCLYGKISLM